MVSILDVIKTVEPQRINGIGVLYLRGDISAAARRFGITEEGRIETAILQMECCGQLRVVWDGDLMLGVQL